MCSQLFLIQTVSTVYLENHVSNLVKSIHTVGMLSFTLQHLQLIQSIISIITLCDFLDLHFDLFKHIT